LYFATNVCRIKDIREVCCCVLRDDTSGVPGFVSRCPPAIPSYCQNTLPPRVQTSMPPPSLTASYAHRSASKLAAGTPSLHCSLPAATAAARPPTYRAVSSFVADRDTGNDVTTPGNRPAGSRATALLNRYAETGVGDGALAARHAVAVRLLERTSNGGDPARR